MAKRTLWVRDDVFELSGTRTGKWPGRRRGLTGSAVADAEVVVGLDAGAREDADEVGFAGLHRVVEAMVGGEGAGAQQPAFVRVELQLKPGVAGVKGERTAEDAALAGAHAEPVLVAAARREVGKRRVADDAEIGRRTARSCCSRSDHSRKCRRRRTPG